MIVNFFPIKESPYWFDEIRVELAVLCVEPCTAREPTEAPKKTALISEFLSEWSSARCRFPREYAV